MHTLYPQRHLSAFEIIWNFLLRTYRNFMDLGLFRSGSVDRLKAISFSYLVTFATNLDVIF